MLVEILRRPFALPFSDPELRTRFEAEPEAVLAEAGLGECKVEELADAQPLAVAELPPAQATYILERCGPPEQPAVEPSVPPTQPGEDGSPASPGVEGGDVFGIDAPGQGAEFDDTGNEGNSGSVGD